MLNEENQSMRDYMNEILSHGLPAKDAAKLCRGIIAAMVFVAIAAFAVAVKQCV